MDKIEKELSDNLLKTGELEGGLFAHVTINYCGRDYVARRDLYTVKNGIVFCVSTSNGKLFQTEDSLWDVKKDCHRIGKYEPSVTYKLRTKTLSYSELKKALNV